MAKRSIDAPTALLAVRGGRCGFAWSQRVWLLPASVNGLLSVNCRIPADKYLIFPVAGILSWGLPPAALRADVKEGFKLITKAELTLDGRTLRPGYVTQTAPFNVRLPVANPLGEPAGLVTMMFRSHFVVFSPLSKGQHTITTVGVFSDAPSDPLGMTYRLTVR
jgi:hypothetical protein